MEMGLLSYAARNICSALGSEALFNSELLCVRKENTFNIFGDKVCANNVLSLASCSKLYHNRTNFFNDVSIYGGALLTQLGNWWSALGEQKVCLKKSMFSNPTNQIWELTNGLLSTHSNLAKWMIPIASVALLGSLINYVSSKRLKNQPLRNFFSVTLSAGGVAGGSYLRSLLTNNVTPIPFLKVADIAARAYLTQQFVQLTWEVMNWSSWAFCYIGSAFFQPFAYQNSSADEKLRKAVQIKKKTCSRCFLSDFELSSHLFGKKRSSSQFFPPLRTKQSNGRLDHLVKEVGPLFFYCLFL